MAKYFSCLVDSFPYMRRSYTNIKCVMVQYGEIQIPTKFPDGTKECKRGLCSSLMREKVLGIGNTLDGDNEKH